MMVGRPESDLGGETMNVSLAISICKKWLLIDKAAC